MHINSFALGIDCICLCVLSVINCVFKNNIYSLGNSVTSRICNMIKILILRFLYSNILDYLKCELQQNFSHIISRMLQQLFLQAIFTISLAKWSLQNTFMYLCFFFFRTFVTVILTLSNLYENAEKISSWTLCYI